MRQGGYGGQKGNKDTQGTKRMLVQATLRSGRRIAKTKDCTTRGDRDDEVEVGGKKREGRRRSKSGRSRRIDAAGRGGQAVSLVAVTPCV